MSYDYTSPMLAHDSSIWRANSLAAIGRTYENVPEIKVQGSFAKRRT
jgi:hypothetical protein